MADSVTLLLPTLNEIDGLTAIMPRVDTTLFDEIILMDGGSTDGSVEFAKAQGYTVMVQSPASRRAGAAGAYEDAIPHISTDVTVTFSPDGNSLPERIPDLLAKMAEGYHMCIVSRYLDGAKSEDDSLLTGIGNFVFTNLVNGLYRTHYTDVMVMFRAWRTETMRRAMRRRPRLDPYAGWDLYMSIYCARMGLRATEIPGDEPARIGGYTKLVLPRNGMSGLRLILGERFRSRDE